MRATFKQLLKGSGTPVLQARDADCETILSAGNIWTSAHARRIELRERGLDPGDYLCCAPRGSFQAIIDFVACAIGGFIYAPVATGCFGSLRRELMNISVACRASMMLCDEQGRLEYHSSRLPPSFAAILPEPGALLALPLAASADGPSFRVFTGDTVESGLDRLTRDLGTVCGATRLTGRCSHHDAGFVADLLLGLCNRQTIYLRGDGASSAAQIVREALELEVDDLVLAPSSIEPFVMAAGRLCERELAALARIRLHTGGEAISQRQREMASALFGKVLVEPIAAALGPVN